MTIQKKKSMIVTKTEGGFVTIRKDRNNIEKTIHTEKKISKL